MKDAKPNILAIGDHPVNLLTLVAALEADSHLQIATSGAAGLALASQRAPDLILLDVMMPEMDGFELCRRLKAELRLRSIPVVFVTALGDTASESAGLALGAADYITMPINVDIARQRIHNLLEREKLRKDVEARCDHLEELLEERTLTLSIAKEAADASSRATLSLAKEAAEAAEAARRAKSFFMSNMSHELLTPMNAIMGMTGLALLRATDPKQADQLGKVELASQQLLSIIHNVLDIAAIEGEHFALDQADFTLNEVLEPLARLTQSEAASKGLALDIEVAPELAGIPLRGDPRRLGQILLALTDNAIKFTAEGTVSVRAAITEDNLSDVVMRFEVKDTGIGISAADQKPVFNSFEQADGSSTRKCGGIGLGLTISKRLAQAMGGDIRVQSQAGVGSTVVATARLKKNVTLPAALRSGRRLSSLDKQHDKIHALLAGISVCMENHVRRSGNPEENKERFRFLINDLFEAALEHFRCEEELLATLYYPLLAEHRRTHDAVIERLSELLATGAQGLVDIVGISMYLVAWFDQHDKHSDMNYSNSH